MIYAVAAFAVLSLIVTITPGPDSLLVLRSSLRGGRRTGARVAAGAACGSLAWGIASAVGVTAVLAAHHAAVTGYTLAFAAVDMVIAGTWLATVAWISDRARTVLHREGVRQMLDRIAGAALVGLGLRVAAEQVTI